LNSSFSLSISLSFSLHYNYLFSSLFFFFTTSFNMVLFFHKRDKNDMYMCEWECGRITYVCRNYSFYPFSYDMLSIYIHTLHCNNVILFLFIMNNKKNELVMIATYYENQIIANQDTIIIIISNIDSNHYKRCCF